mmetsp:Transcript_12077/g.18942  ORF Transcript_12077/g.18942 Transcript_12077/m.18942 type:complete len:256 (-) Transcript_12077:1001-1768(-)
MWPCLSSSLRSLEDELDTQQVLRLHLCDIVHDILVVQQMRARSIVGLSLASWYHHPFLGGDVSLFIRGGFSAALHTQLGFGHALRQVSLCLVQLMHIAQRNLAKEQNGIWVRRISMTVVRRLGRHIREIYTLAEHVAGHWCLWRSNPQPLRENPHPIGQPGTVPQKHPIVRFGKRLVPLVFSFPFHFKQINKLERVVRVGLGMCILKVLLDHLPLFSVLLDWHDIGTKTLVVGIQLAFSLSNNRSLGHVHCDLQL